MSDNKNVDTLPEKGQQDSPDPNIAVSSSEVSSVAGSVKISKTQQRVTSTSERQIKFERAQKCLENAALVSKRIKEHRKATAELLGRPFEDDDPGDTASEMASTMSEKTGYSVATDTSTTLSVQDALNIPGISESLANTLKQKELLMERIKQYKEISKRPIIKSSPISRRESVTEPKSEIRKPIDNTDVAQLQNTIKDKENALSVIQVKMRAMETTILELQEKITEKDQIIEAKNMATTLMSDNMSKKEKDSLTLLQDTRDQMTKMQENFINMQSEWKEEKAQLLKELETKNDKIISLEEANTILENARFEISQAHAKVMDELEVKNREINELSVKLEQLSAENIVVTETKPEIVEEEKGSLEISNMEELTKKVELLEQLNCQIRQANKELESKLASTTVESRSSSGSPSKKASPLPTRKGRNTAAKMKSPWSQMSSESIPQEIDKKANKTDAAKLEAVVQSLNKDILEKEYTIAQKNTLITELQSANAEKDNVISELQSNASQQKNLSIDMVDIGISTEATASGLANIPKDEELKQSSDEVDTPQSLGELEEKLKEAQHQIEQLNNEIDAANKNMIKVKSSHKLKLKQMQKTIDNCSKVSDANAEIIRLNEELHQLTQKVAELEEEKGNLQLHLVDYDSGRLTESDVYKKMVEMEHLAEVRLNAISDLETQKFDLVQELHVLEQKNLEMEDKVADMMALQNEHVCTEMNSVQLEEQIDELTASKKELELIIENLKLDKEHFNETIVALQEEKEELNHKLEHYIQENMELTDKLEKLSAEKVSSAESIEIVESLTTQEKLELAEYNKGMIVNKIDESEDIKQSITPECNENIEKLVEESAELNKKIELFTQERQEVMEKMSKISTENELLQQKISDLTEESSKLQSNLKTINEEKLELQSLNDELSRNIEELKRERLEIMKEAIEMPKPTSVEEAVEGTAMETQTDDKTLGNKGTKSVKQLTKEILKLKNTIKEREDEIADCQMKILSLEEQQQKQNELIQNNVSFENKLKALFDENNQLKEELETSKKARDAEQQMLQFKEANELLQQELHKIQQEYSATIGARDSRIQELEKVLNEYEKQIYNYSNTLQIKDKEMTEYINQITKLNDVSQKLKSTIELLEEEKAKDQNAELVKSLNKQVAAYQKKLAECEDKIKTIEEEKSQLLSLKGSLENKNNNLDEELKSLQEAYLEKQNVIKDLQTQQQKNAEEMAAIKLQSKERDEEIHEIKLQLRKESIENEKLRNSLSEKDSSTDSFTNQIDELKEALAKATADKDDINEKYVTMETKNKELMEKLKKFAVNIKKKSTMYSELESQFNEIQQQLASKNQQLEQLLIQVDTLPTLQDKLKYAEEELNRLQSIKQTFDREKSDEIGKLLEGIQNLQNDLASTQNQVLQLTDALNQVRKEKEIAYEENGHLLVQIDTLEKKIIEFEIDQKNNMNFVTKISSLESDINQKQSQIVELLNKLESQEQQLNQLQLGHDCKVQERDLYIENLEAEITKYKNRIGRLEESVSAMEDWRHSLERKADQLGSQLEEKQKAYSEYTNQEDELVSRLAVLMDHDRVLEKQLREIESENKELQYKLQHLTDENQRLHKSLSDIQEHCNTLTDKAMRLDAAEAELGKYQTQVHELDNHLKKLTQDHNLLLSQKKHEIEELEAEFNTQIENAIKEKKTLNEKYEKVSEHVTQLERTLQEYRLNIQNLNDNIEEISRVNQQLTENANKEHVQTPDYTEQYINEINKLNSVINGKNQDIFELNNKIQTLQTNNMSSSANYESKVSELVGQLQVAALEIQRLLTENNTIKENLNVLQDTINEKDAQIKELTERSTLKFEMNIPKTEGMLITSTIEQLSQQPQVDVSSIESQIIGSNEEEIISPVKVSEQTQKMSSEGGEPLVVAKKAYQCYQNDPVPEETDPFNSDEGWGLGAEEPADITPGITQLNNQIQQLTKEKEAMKADLDSSNAKLIKALKKLKEFKSSNEMLTKELNLSKQISQSSFLDSAIEDELRINIQELEKKLQEAVADLAKEKRDKEALKKQNEVFNNANDRLTEMKEKMDNEISLWKFKFKEANDKASSLQWGGEAKDTPVQSSPVPSSDHNNRLKDEITKLEKENDEFQTLIDQLTAQNKDLSIQQTQLKNEISNIKTQLQEQQASVELKSKLDSLNAELLEAQTSNNELKQQLDELKLEKEELLKTIEQLKKLADKGVELEKQVQSLKEIEIEDKTKIENLLSEMENMKTRIVWHEEQHNISKSHDADALALSEKCSALEDQCHQLQSNLQSASTQISELECLNKDLSAKFQSYEDQIISLDDSIQALKSEKEQLLTTISELQLTITNNADTKKLLEDEYNNKVISLENTVKDLTQKIETNENLNHESTEKIQQLIQEKEQLSITITELRTSTISSGVSSDIHTDTDMQSQKINDYETQISVLNTKLQHLNNENDQLLSTVTELRSSISTAVDQRGFEIAELWKQHLAQRENDFQRLEQELREQVSAAELKYEQLLDNVQSSSQEETNKLVMMEQVNSLQVKLQDKEEHLSNLQDKYSEVISQMDVLRSEIEDEKIMLENKLLGQQEEYEKQIDDLLSKNKENSESFEQSFAALQNELAAAKSTNEELSQKVHDLNEVIKDSEENVLDLTNQLRMKDSEIYQKTHDYQITLNQRNEEFENVRKQLLEYEKKVEDLSFEKESELAVLRLKMHEKGEHHEKLNQDNETEKAKLAEALNAKIVECTALNKQIADLNSLLEEHSNRTREMQVALENQELEIVTLKDEIANLEDMHRASMSKIQKHVTFASDTKPGAEIEKAEDALNKELLDAVPRAELDLALYMLHQRDVRCEELTMELTQLLEERDTLQLRLSDSLRSHEELKSKCSSAGLDVSVSSSSETVSELPTFAMEKEFVDVHRGQTSRSSSISDPDGDKPKLQAKLSELRTVRHSRDVRLRQDSEQRQLGLRLMQRDVASLPPEAVEQLAQAHHTLSRDSQSTSTVLLNWLRGKSTPKVVHM